MKKTQFTHLLCAVLWIISIPVLAISPQLKKIEVEVGVAAGLSVDVQYNANNLYNLKIMDLSQDSIDDIEIAKLKVTSTRPDGFKLRLTSDNFAKNLIAENDKKSFLVRHTEEGYVPEPSDSERQSYLVSLKESTGILGKNLALPQSVSKVAKFHPIGQDHIFRPVQGLSSGATTGKVFSLHLSVESKSTLVSGLYRDIIAVEISDL